jgi:hypothetical protein
VRVVISEANALALVGDVLSRLVVGDLSTETAAGVIDLSVVAVVVAIFVTDLSLSRPLPAIAGATPVVTIANFSSSSGLVAAAAGSIVVIADFSVAAIVEVGGGADTCTKDRAGCVGSWSVIVRDIFIGIGGRIDAPCIDESLDINGVSDIDEPCGIDGITMVCTGGHAIGSMHSPFDKLDLSASRARDGVDEISNVEIASVDRVVAISGGDVKVVSTREDGQGWTEVLNVTSARGFSRFVTTPDKVSPAPRV